MESDLKADIRNAATNEIHRQYLSASKARKILNWKPLFTLEEGLQKTIDWYEDFFEHERKC
jgi:CDP-glucose 4,6-dehydratase